jgi:hypothetical protein
MIYLLAITCNSVGIAGAISDVVLQSLENFRASMVNVKTMYMFISLYNEYTYTVLPDYRPERKARTQYHGRS